MPAAAVQGTGTFASTSSAVISQAFTASNPVAGNLLIARVRWNSTTATCSVAGSLNGALTAIGSPTTNATMGERSQLFYKENCSGGAETLTATISVAVTYRVLSVHEVSGIATSGALDANNGATGSSTAPAVSVTTVTDHDFLMGAGDVAQTATAGAGFTSWTSVDGNVTEYKLDQTPTGAVSVAFTQSPTGQWIATGAAFELPAAAGALPPILVMAPPLPSV